MTLPFHPLANIFPLIEGPEFDALVASIKANGLRDPIVLHEGMVLDGRNRQRACGAAGVDCKYEVFPADGNALALVIDKNLNRRHLNESQRSFVAAKLANLSAGRPTETAQNCAVSQDEAAQRLNVSRRSVQHAATVRDKATREIQQAVEQGKLPVSSAAKAATLPTEVQRDIAREAKAGNDAVVRNTIKRETRADREFDLAAKIVALPTKQYGVVVADPEWRFEPWSRETGMDRAADNHYPTSCLEVIKSRDVASIAAKDCVLFLWATVPMLPHALAVMAAWGFEYRSHCVWIKDRIGTGYWFRNKHELLLLGVKGAIPAPAMGTQWDSAQGPIMVQAHSQKPDDFLMMIEAYFPTLPKIELNRRGEARKGWDAWGNEAVPTELPPHDPDTGEILGERMTEEELLAGLAPLCPPEPEIVRATCLTPTPFDLPDIPEFLRR